MGRAVKALIALVIAGMLALSGCSGQNPNQAATVDGVAIPVSEVDALLPALTPYLQTPGTGAVVSLLVVSRVGTAIAQQRGLEFSADERQATVASLPTGLTDDPSLAGFVDDYVTTVLVSQSLAQEDFLTAASGVEVVVNPRFGSWDVTHLAVVAGTGSLSSPAPVS